GRPLTGPRNGALASGSPTVATPSPRTGNHPQFVQPSAVDLDLAQDGMLQHQPAVVQFPHAAVKLIQSGPNSRPKPGPHVLALGLRSGFRRSSEEDAAHLIPTKPS